MEIDDLKKVWTKVNRDSDQPIYSIEDIADFRKSRSKDFSAWIQNGLILDIILKGLFSLAYIVLIYLLRESLTFTFIATGVILLGTSLIFLEYRYFKSSKHLDKRDISVQEGIRAKLTFLKTYYYRIQFLQGLSNPMIVSAGIFFYYYFTYGEIRIEDFEDLVVTIVLLLISFALTLPTTLSLYGYHFRVLQNSLANLEEEGSFPNAVKRYNRQKKLLHWLIGSLLIIGLGVLIFLLLIY